jgi:type IV pilus biogenesis protein PilP
MQNFKRVMAGIGVTILTLGFSAMDASRAWGNDNQTLEEYSHLKDQEILLKEKEKIQELKDKKNPPPYPMPYNMMNPQSSPKKHRRMFDVYSVRGIGRHLTAVIADRHGDIFYAHPGDPLPGGFIVLHVTGHGVDLVKGDKVVPLSFRVEVPVHRDHPISSPSNGFVPPMMPQQMGR